MKAAIVLPILLLQKPSRKSKAKEHSTCLERRLSTWQDGDLNDLLLEGRTIQRRIPALHPADGCARLARSFANLMFQGKTKSAIRLLTEETKGGVLHLSDIADGQRSVREILVDKHPAGQPVHPEALIQDDPGRFIPYYSRLLMHP